MKSCDPIAGLQMLAIAVRGERNAMNELHREVRSPGLRRAGVEYPRDGRVVHHRQRLPLGLEARDDFFRVHPELDDLESDPPVERLALLGHVDDAHPTLAQDLEELVGTDELGMIEWAGRLDAASVRCAGRVVDSH